MDEFIAILETYGVPATPRTRRGIDIDAGCGQLKADLLRKRTPTSTTTSGSTADALPTTTDSTSGSATGVSSIGDVALTPQASRAVLNDAIDQIEQDIFKGIGQLDGTLKINKPSPSSTINF